MLYKNAEKRLNALLLSERNIADDDMYFLQSLNNDRRAKVKLTQVKL